MNAPFRVEHDGMGVVIIRTESQISSFEDTCPHAYWPLSEGILRDGMLEIDAEIIGDVVRLQWEAKASPAKA